jgi:WD40 repeat protein
VSRLSTGDVVYKYKGHNKELTSLDFDGTNLVTGGMNGTVNIYETQCEGVTAATSLGTALFSLQHHAMSVTGVKIISRDNRKFGWEDAPYLMDTESNLIISCSMDKTIAAVDIISGKVLWRTQLLSTPLCLDATPDSAYIGVGTVEGTVHFFSVKTGREVLSFQAHMSSVVSLHLKSTNELITGSEDVSS